MEFGACLGIHAQEIRAAAGAALCALCIRQAENNLRTLPGLYQECLHQILPISRRADRPRVSGTRERDRLNISALETRHDILAVLGSWAGFVAEKLAAAVPERSVPQLAGFLLRNLGWLTAQTSAAEFADEMEGLRAQLVRIIDPGPGDTRTHVRKCVVEDCTGTISASPQAAGGSGAPGTPGSQQAAGNPGGTGSPGNTAGGTGSSTGKSSIRCSSGHTWDMHEWITLRPLLERQRKAVSA